MLSANLFELLNHISERRACKRFFLHPRFNVCRSQTYIQPSPKPMALRLPHFLCQFYWVASSSRLSFIRRRRINRDGDGSFCALPTKKMIYTPVQCVKVSAHAIHIIAACAAIRQAAHPADYGLSASHRNLCRGQTFTFCCYLHFTGFSIYCSQNQHCLAVEQLSSVGDERLKR